MLLNKIKLKQSKGFTLVRSAGFTLVELLVVISIVAVLSAIGVTVFRGIQRSAQISKVRADLHNIRNAIAILRTQTGLLPGKLPTQPCIQNPEVFLNSCAAGLACSDGGFPNWAGPYMNPVPKDPWGREYFFDPDYTCNGQLGCENIPNGTFVRAIESAGPDGEIEYGDDDIALVLCRQ